MERHQEGPVTVVVRHRIKPSRQAEFEEWLRGITGAMLGFPGQQGFNVVRPVDTGRPEYLIFFRFDTFENLEAWERSEERHTWLDQLDALSTHSPTRERYTGLEVWFTPRPGCKPPPRWKMLFVTLLAIYPLISLVQWIVVPMMPQWPIPLRTLLTSTLLVCVMTYLVMPLMTRAFSGWLYSKADVSSALNSD